MHRARHPTRPGLPPRPPRAPPLPGFWAVTHRYGGFLPRTRASERGDRLDLTAGRRDEVAEDAGAVFGDSERWVDGATHIHHVRAAGVEVTARRRVGR